ncbi:hypothetical protein [Chachezhania sediminis]|uniref:hypothetical protein n=1 Tax=Chachezhania sediminis TaxID=2599291 RepID=UPI00131D606D|nr:hypothetical protein [Chachezhania sediminis]
MTALKRYERLEATGLWRAGPRSQRREVVVSLGEATLTITDMRDRVLAHWSLAALERRNPGVLPAIYGPDGDPDETLEFEGSESVMIDALDRIRSAIHRTRPRRGRVRTAVVTGIAAVLGLTLLAWAPVGLRRHALAVVPAVTRIEVGQELLRRVARLTGPLCAGTLRNTGAPARDGTKALALLATRTGARQIVLLTDSPQPSLHLPGGLVALDSQLVAPSEDPAVAAGYILRERVLANEEDPLDLVLRKAGPLGVLSLLTRGTLPARALDRYAETLLTSAPETPDPAALAQAFAAAQIPPGPFLAAEAASGRPLPDIAASGTAEVRPVLEDQDWVQLQGLCPTG